MLVYLLWLLAQAMPRAPMVEAPPPDEGFYRRARQLHVMLRGWLPKRGPRQLSVFDATTPMGRNRGNYVPVGVWRWIAKLPRVARVALIALLLTPIMGGAGVVYYINTAGDDTRSAAVAQNPATPWKTPMKAYSQMVTDDVTIVQDGTWDGATALLDSRGLPNLGGTGNYHPTRAIFRVLVGDDPVFRIPYGTGVDHGTPGVSGSSGHVWMFINPDDLLIDIQPGASLTVGDYEDVTHPYPISTYHYANGSADVPSAIYFATRSGRAGPLSANNPTIRGLLIVPGYQGNGVKFNENIQGGSLEPAAGWNTPGDPSFSYDISHCATGIRWGDSLSSTDGTRFQTVLTAAGAINDTTITVASLGTAGTSKCISTDMGQRYICIDTGLGNVEWRVVTAINGLVLTLGAGPYPSFALEKNHINGAQVRVMGGAIGGNSHHNDKRGKSVVGAEFGSEGYSMAFNSHHIVIADFQSFENWQYDTVAGYVDGGGVETYGLREDSSCWITHGRMFSNQGITETGTNIDPVTGHPTWGNGNWRMDWMDLFGKGDQRDQPPGTTPAAPLSLMRASKYAEVEHNNYHIVSGNDGDGGYRVAGGGTFGGEFDHLKVKNNAIIIDYLTGVGAPGVGTPIYNYQGGAIAAGTELNHNYIYYTNGYTGDVINWNGTDYTVAQLAAAQAATGLLAGDVWTTTVPPGFVDSISGDFTILPGSPLIGAGSDGRDIGASRFIAPPPPPSGNNFVEDQFSNTTVDGWDPADVTGGAYTLIGTASSFDKTAGFGTIVVTAASQTNMAHLNSVSKRDAELTVRVKTDKVPVGGYIEVVLCGRTNADVAFIAAKVRFNTDGTTLINHQRAVASATSSISPNGAVPFPHDPLPPYAANVDHVIKFRYAGAKPTKLMMKVWRAGNPEPSWQLLDYDLLGPQVAGGAGIRVSAQAGFSVAPITFTFDSLVGVPVGNSDLSLILLTG